MLDPRILVVFSAAEFARLVDVDDAHDLLVRESFFQRIRRVYAFKHFCHVLAARLLQHFCSAGLEKIKRCVSASCTRSDPDLLELTCISTYSVRL